MTFSDDSLIWQEFQKWKSLYAPTAIYSNTESEFFSNFSSNPSNQFDEFDFNSMIDSISKQLSFDVIQNIMKVIYNGAIFHSFIKTNQETAQENLIIKKSRSLTNLNKMEPLLDQPADEFIDFDNFDSSDSDGNRNQTFNTIS
ncbi:hypothetical protein TRFO_22746 [Tritrichomonas foetus]|uniref:Uncharacterized protein n=1 Tax=Tritrichomonas foetus TaxID=1144522 RepID=A0A1J4KFV2_9EUKA|nr:hypothetical protein TRFO_22746 [Tritrichomonas foetus]|eukprot:OHT08660.1 hypothetical protein TRFO_22746 [Tritrichomonas foetus]